MKFVKSPYKIECPSCKEMKKNFVFRNKNFICVDCNNKIFVKKYKRPKLTKIQIDTIKKNLKDFENNRPKVQILYGGCFN